MLKSIVPYLERSKQRMVCLAIYLLLSFYDFTTMQETNLF